MGYAQIDRQVFYNPGADAGKQIKVGFVQGVGADYENKNIAWGSVAKPSTARHSPT